MPHGRTRVIGVWALGAVAGANVVLWIAARPGGQPDGRYVGELLGAEAVLLFACSLVLMTLLGAVERAFGGLDRVVIWHRRTAVAGAVLLVPHVALATSAAIPAVSAAGVALGDIALVGIAFLVVWALAPSLRAARWPGVIRRLAGASYERWLTAHALTGLFVAAAVAHGAIVDPVLHRSRVLLVAFVVTGVVGLGAYLYRELLASRVVSSHAYRIGAARRVGDTALEVGLDPVGEPLRFSPGQFVVVSFGGLGSWQRHPFSVTSSPSQPRLELAVKAAGNYTAEMYDRLHPGLPARVVGPFGGFDYRGGGRDQVWIAGGIGITPFVSWIRSIDGDFDRSVDLYYSVARPADALYRDEIEAAAAGRRTLRVHVRATDDEGHLMIQDVVSDAADRQGLWVYMCGPPAMMKGFEKGLRRSGVPASQIRWENFQVR
jgi:predicted ferric reductase